MAAQDEMSPIVGLVRAQMFRFWDGCRGLRARLGDREWRASGWGNAVYGLWERLRMKIVVAIRLRE